MRGFLVRHSQLGLGKVIDAKNGALHVRFLDSGQKHAFGIAGFQSGLLSRERLGRGTRCRIGADGEGAVERLATQPAPGSAEPFAYELTTLSGEVRICSEIDLEPVSGAQSADPLLRFAGLQVQPYTLFKSRDSLRSAYARLLHDGAGLRALLASRVDLRPHQAFVAGTVILDPRRRYILADEVGLGKTIEAGIVIHDLLAQKPDAKILILCPGALTQQWLCELYAKFGGQLFTLVDLHQPLLLNWARVQKAIVSISLAAYRVGSILERIDWDMVVVDEVHHLLASTTLYQFVERLSRRTPSVLLLSAIPAHEREDEFLRLLALLEPERYAVPEVKHRFSALYALQTQLGRGLRVLTHRIEGYERGEFTLDDLRPIARRLLELEIVNEDDELRSRLDTIREVLDAASGNAELLPPQAGVADEALASAVSGTVSGDAAVANAGTPRDIGAPMDAGTGIDTRDGAGNGRGLDRAADGAPKGDTAAEAYRELARRQVAADFREFVHDLADRYRINRRILRNRRQRLVEQAQIAVIERKICRAPYTPDQPEIAALDAICALLRGSRDAGLDADLLAAFARTLLQSATSPATALALLRRLEQTKPEAINAQGRELVLMGHTVGYADWELYQELLFRLVKAKVPADRLTRALDAVRTWQAAGALSIRMLHLVELLAQRATRAPRPKLLVFAGYPGLAGQVLAAVTQRFGAAAVTEFRADLEPEQKELNVVRLQQDPATWIMVSDESGGEGRNFQFASELFHVDTPWHTARVEQRIGRLDRLGRELFSSDVTSVVLYNEAAPEAGLVHCFDDGIGVYRHSISGLEFALRQVERDLLALAIDTGRDGLFDHALTLRDVVERERAQDQSEAVLDEASFERSAAVRYRAVVRSDHADKSIEAAVLDYVRQLTWNSGVHDLQDPQYPKQVWRIRPETTRYGALPVDGRQAQGLTGVFDGTFRRSIAQQRPTLHFFSIGDPLFDAVIRSLDVQVTGRTYAIECSAPDAELWSGFEFTFLATPDLAALADWPGLANQARGTFLPKATRVFVSLDGTIDRNDEALLAVRRRCEFRNHGTTWWDLSGVDKASLLRAAVGGRDWQDTLLGLHEIAQHEAQTRILARRGDDLRTEIARLLDAERQLTALALRGDQGAAADAEAMKRVRLAVNNWRPGLDSVGFLSVNGRIRFLTAPR
jgi:hypothetical protein